MAEAKTPAIKKMAQVVKPDGSVEFKFGKTEGNAIVAGGPAITAALADFPQNVRDFFALIGMRTKLRNFTTPDEDAGAAGETPERMYEKFKAGYDRLVKGELRVTRTGDEKAPASTLVLEAALIYRKMKAVVLPVEQGGQGIAPNDPRFDAAWRAAVSGVKDPETGELVPDTLESLRPMVEGMDNTVTNQAAVDEAVAKLQAERAEKGEQPLAGDDLDAFIQKATVTQLDQLKQTAVFKLAMGEAKKAREATKQAALVAAAAKELGASPL